MWLHSLKVAQLLRGAAFLHTNQSRSYLNHLVFAVRTQQEEKWSAVSNDETCVVLMCTDYCVVECNVHTKAAGNVR